MAFARPGGVVFGAGAELAVPDVAAARCEIRILSISIDIR